MHEETLIYISVGNLMEKGCWGDQVKMADGTLERILKEKSDT
jgi:hypothetical protein